ALIWNVCPGPAKHVADAMHNTTHNNHNTTPPQTICEIIPAVDIPSLNTVQTTSQFPYMDADKKKHVFYYPLSHTGKYTKHMAGICWTDQNQMSTLCDLHVEEHLRCPEDTSARALEQAEATEEAAPGLPQGSHDQLGNQRGSKGSW
ncbi:hypothetical protein PAXRUDRAFT_152006, partial [Paxillus rubicundulus Ve08.2h10]